jgi:GDP-L-fucose synthase
MSEFWRGKRVVVTGGGGFVGARVVQALRKRGVAEDSIVVPRSRCSDLRLAANCADAVRGSDVVIHLAASTGGIAFSRAHPASQYRDCMQLNLNMLEAAREAGVGRFLSLGNLLAYPANARSPLREGSLHDGPVAASHMGIGLAKRDLVAMAEMYACEYGMNIASVLAANAYGPGDRFDPAHSHVIPATIAKCFRDEDLVVWGDGSPTRDFLFVDDLAEGLLLAAERLPAGGVVNLASGREVSIADLVRMIAGLCGFERRIVFDAEKGSGDPRRVASTIAASELIGFVPGVGLEDGLRMTIDWYRAQPQGSGSR